MLDNIFFEKTNKINFPTMSVYYNPLYIKRFISKFDIIKDSAMAEGNFEIYDMCIDIEMALDKINISNQQRERLRLWRLGYKEIEISKQLGVTRIAIHRSLVSVCTKISKYLVGDS